MSFTSDSLLFLLDDPEQAEEVLVAGATPPPADAPAATTPDHASGVAAAPESRGAAPAGTEGGGLDGPPGAAPALLAPDEAFPSIAALDAMLAASREAPAETATDLAARTELAGMMGLDLAVAADAEAFRQAAAAWVPAAPDLPFDETTPLAPLPQDWLLG